MKRLLILGNREGGKSSCELETTFAAKEINMDADKAANFHNKRIFSVDMTVLLHRRPTSASVPLITAVHNG